MAEHVPSKLRLPGREQKRGGKAGVHSPHFPVRLRHPEENAGRPHCLARRRKSEGVPAQGFLILGVRRASPARTRPQGGEVNLGDIEVGNDPEQIFVPPSRPSLPGLCGEQGAVAVPHAGRLEAVHVRIDAFDASNLCRDVDHRAGRE